MVRGAKVATTVSDSRRQRFISDLLLAIYLTDDCRGRGARKGTFGRDRAARQLRYDPCPCGGEAIGSSPQQ